MSSAFDITMPADLFKTVIEAVGALVTECRLHVGDAGISVCTVDSSNVAMVDLTLSSEACSAYVTAASAPPIDVGLDINAISSVTNLIGKGGDVALRYADDGKLNVEFGGYRYTIPTIDPRSIRADPKVPEKMKMPVNLYLDASVFVEAVKAAVSIGERVVFAVDPESKVFSIEGQDKDTKRQLRKELRTDTVAYTALETARSLYSHDYLKDMCKPFAKADDKIYLSLGTDQPVQFTFSYAGGKGNIKYLLAPRIEQE